MKSRVDGDGCGVDVWDGRVCGRNVFSWVGGHDVAFGMSNVMC